MGELFHDRYRDILNRYPLAQAVAAEIWPRLRDEADAISLEDFLRDELLKSPTAHRQSQYWALPLYFQDLLYDCGLRYSTHPDNFDRLVNALLDLERVVFVTLNYDTIFDRVLGKYYTFDSLDSYIAHKHVALIKLHGSVNWGRRIDTRGLGALESDGYRGLCHALAEDDTRVEAKITEMWEAPGPDPTQMRSSSRGVFYPALALPLGPDDEPACPPTHSIALQQTLNQQSYGSELHLLIIGYSCLDKTPLAFIGESGSRVASAVIVNGTEQAGRDALERLQQHLGGAAPWEHKDSDFVELFDGGFTAFASPAKLRSVVERVRSA